MRVSMFITNTTEVRQAAARTIELRDGLTNDELNLYFSGPTDVAIPVLDKLIEVAQAIRTSALRQTALGFVAPQLHPASAPGAGCSVPGCTESWGHSVRHLPGFAGPADIPRDVETELAIQRLDRNRGLDTDYDSPAGAGDKVEADRG